MDSSPENLAALLSVVIEELEADGLTDAAAVLKSAEHSMDKTIRDNWTGTNFIWTINLTPNPKEFYRLGDKVKAIRGDISARLIPRLETDTSDRFLVSITPKAVGRADQRIPSLNHRYLFSRLHLITELLQSEPMKNEIDAIETSIRKNPAHALGLTKDMLEGYCKTVLTMMGKNLGKSPRPVRLVDRLLKEIQLVSDQISNVERGAALIEKMLKDQLSIARTLDELRNKYGSGHGRGADHVGIEPRHAHLALASVTAFISFVTETLFQHPDFDGFSGKG